MDVRSKERIAYHYAVEKELAFKLRQSTRDERKALYVSVYDELFDRVSDHQQWQRKGDLKKSKSEARRQLRFIRRFLRPDTVFMEVGAGDCALSKEVARRIKTAYAVDVAKDILSAGVSRNLDLVLSDGISVPLPLSSIDVAYSNQLMEHLHPEDAWEQLCNIHAILKPGGVYICVTPNRLSGPHDISRHFDEYATGLHLKEYTITELSGLLKNAGFTTTKILLSWHLLIIPLLLPLYPFLILEKALCKLPTRLRRIVAVPIGAAKMVAYRTREKAGPHGRLPTLV